MINQKLQVKMDEIEADLVKLRAAPIDPEQRRKVVVEVVGDAQEYLEKLLVFLRELAYAPNV